MNYKDREYKQFMIKVTNGHYQVLEVSLRVWERVITRHTLKCTNGDDKYDYIHKDAENLYQVQVEISENGERKVLPELIEFNNEEQAEKVYEELLKRRARK